MGSKSDWETMRHADEILTRFGVEHECGIVSAHRTPEFMAQYAKEAVGRGIQLIIAGAGGAAHLPGMVAAHTILPVLGVPVESSQPLAWREDQPNVSAANLISQGIKPLSKNF